MPNPQVDLDPQDGCMTNRNGSFPIRGLEIMVCPERTYISGISAAKGVLLQGGITLKTTDLPALHACLGKIIESEKLKAPKASPVPETLPKEEADLEIEPQFGHKP